MLHLRWRQKTKKAGINTSEIRNKPRMLTPATSPIANSFSSVLLVKKNTPKPMAAVRLVKKVTIPILSTMRSRDFILLGFPGILKKWDPFRK
jgi:hypothetical protein